MSNMNWLTELPKLLEQQKQLEEYLDRLNKMRGMTNGPEDVIPKCYGIKFETQYGPHLYTYGDFPDLNVMLVDTAINYYTNRLSSAKLLIGLADQALKTIKMPEVLE